MGRWGPVQAPILGQDGGLEFLQCPAWVDAQLLSKRLADPPIGLQRLGLPTRAVQAEQELLVQLLTQRLPRDQRLQLPDQLGVPPEGQIGLNPGLQDGEPLLLEPGALGLRERLVGELRQRRAAPQLQRLAELGRGESRRRAERLGALVGEPLKAG